ncbi:MAG: undecaprenyl-diphosphatase UppP [Clostridiaceae bacterium]|nr:undecaprenyl-diphosphatase UppP [Clostridiaceae bacterium]
MNTFTAILLGIVQGLTEFLPISSSGHLVIFQEFLGMNDLEESHLLFDTFLHIGTLISIFLVYGKDVWNLVKAFFELLRDIGNRRRIADVSPSRKMLFLLIVATIPAVVVGFAFKDAIEALFKSVEFVAVALLVTGFLLWLTSKLISGTKEEKDTKYSNALMIGFFQCAALMPGISRSGSTIVGGLLNGLKKEFAVKFSFLMSVPAIMGAAVLQIPDLVRQGFNSEETIPILAGTLAAAITGFVAIKFLIALLNKGKFYLFSYYCWAVGGVLLLYGLFR